MLLIMKCDPRVQSCRAAPGKIARQGRFFFPRRFPAREPAKAVALLAQALGYHLRQFLTRELLCGNSALTVQDVVGRGPLDIKQFWQFPVQTLPVTDLLPLDPLLSHHLLHGLQFGIQRNANDSQALLSELRIQFLQ